MDCTKTLKLRLKDKHAKVLRQMAREVNQVWNHINALSAKAARPFHGKPKYLSGYDLQKFTAGYSKCDGIAMALRWAAAQCRWCAWNTPHGASSSRKPA